MEKTVKTLKLLVVILALMNMCLLVFIWHGKGHHGPPHDGPHGGPHGGGPGARLIHELNFNEKQIADFEKLKEEHHGQVMKLQEDSRIFRDSLFEKLKTVISATEVSALADSVAGKQKAIELVTFDHFNKVRNLCDAEQKKKFDNIIDDILRHLLGPPSAHGPPPPHP
jgi:protein CpxP